MGRENREVVTVRRGHRDGSVRRLPSGRYQARVRDQATNQLVSVGAYATKADANKAIAIAIADQARGAWVDPRAGRTKFGEYARRWLEGRTDLRPRTAELYAGLLRRHLLPTFGRSELGAISTSAVRSWRSKMLSTTGDSTTARTYRLLRTILGDAAADDLIVKNPCTLKSAGVERAPERPVATIPQVMAVADAVGDRYRLAVLLGTFCSLRWGEIAGLARRHVDLVHGRVIVEREVEEALSGTGPLTFGLPKSAAGSRTVSIPPHLLDDVKRHLERWAQPGAEGLLFPSNQGAPIRRSHWSRRWRAARKTAGLVDGFRFHDLRHTGNTLAAMTGASTKELMARMGHASPRAALIYQHATEARDDAIAARLTELVNGTDMAPVVQLVGHRNG